MGLGNCSRGQHFWTNPKGRGPTYKFVRRMIWRSADQIVVKFYQNIATGPALNLLNKIRKFKKNGAPGNFEKMFFPKIYFFNYSDNRRYFLVTLFGLFFWEKWYMIRWPWPTFSRSNLPFSKKSLNLDISQMVWHTGNKFYSVFT